MEKYQTVLEQHQQMHTRFDRLRVLACAPANVLPEQRMHKLLVHELGEFLVLVKEHFEFEEKDGFMTDVYKKRPSLTPKLDRLLDQHVAIQQELENLASLCGTETIHLESVQADLTKTLDLLSEHEEVENDIMQMYLLQDTGVGD